MSHWDIREARRLLGLTQAKLGAIMGVNANTVSQWERGTRRIGAGAGRLLQAYLSGYRPDDWPKKKT